MITFQDLSLINPNDEDRKKEFVRSVIQDHKSSDAYKIAVMGYEYDHKRNTTIVNYQKTLTTISGRIVPDEWSPNHKTVSNFFNYFTTQQNQFLLGNGVTWDNPKEVEKKLGTNFDSVLQKAGKAALVQGESFGFFNVDHVELFELREFAPLYDEENGSLRSGVRFWQIDYSKPLRATLYEEDGYTSYIWHERLENGKYDDTGRVYKKKQPYIIEKITTQADNEVIYNGYNYPTFPIVPLWGSPLHQSELVGIQEQIDAYDLIKNGFLNDLDTAQLYWIIKGAGGMDDPDLAQLMDRLHRTHFASADNDQEIQPVTVDIPYNAREALLERIERDLYKDYGALNVNDIKGGAVTATQIMAAYEPLNTKADQYEYCIIDFIKGLCNVAGIEVEPTFTRSKLVNTGEEMQNVLQAAEYLDDEYVTEKLLNLLGDGDRFEEIQERKAANELEMGEVTPTRNASMYEITSVLGKLKRGNITERTALAMLQRIGLSEEEAQETIDMQIEEGEEFEEETEMPVEEEDTSEDADNIAISNMETFANDIIEMLKKLMGGK